MSATFETVMEVKRVTDHDCGNYRIGEMDFGIQVGAFTRLSIKELRETRDVLSHLNYEVTRRIMELSKLEAQALVSESVNGKETT